MSLLVLSFHVPAYSQSIDPLMARQVMPPTVAVGDDISAGRIQARMAEFVSQGVIAGAVTWVTRGGKLVHAAATGFRDLESRTPMTVDTLFRVQSMTKPVTAVAIMLLVDEGRLTLTDPVAKYIPAFPASPTGRLANIRDLLTHTAGLSGDDPSELHAIGGKQKLNLAELTPYLLKMKVQWAPGSRYEYSGPGFNLLGRIVEVVAGESFDLFVARRILEPLGMNDTSFFARPGDRNRMAHVYRIDGSRLVSQPDDQSNPETRLPNPAGGLYSTAADMSRFLDMMRCHGVFEGRRILSQASAEVMTRLHTNELPVGSSPATGYGLGWTVVRSEYGALSLQSIGSYGHGGSWGTYMWVDPKKDLAGVLMLQRVGGGNAERSAFVALASASANDP